jgi:hypothetical protein
MRLYPDVPRSRATTIAGDAAVLLAVAVFAWLGTVVHDSVEELLPVSLGVQSAGRSVEGALNEAGDAVGGAPVVGGQVKEALQEAGRGTGGEAVRAGRSGEEGIRDLANVLGWLTFLVPSALLLSRAVPPRVAKVRRLTAAERVLAVPDDPHRRMLLAQRAAFGLPYATLLRHTRDPLGDLAAGRIEPLIAAVREDAGLNRPSGRRADRAARRSPA